MSSISTGLPRTILGPLETTYSLPSACGIAVQLCSTCSQGFQGQTCFSFSTDTFYDPTGAGLADNTNCWPPRASFVNTPPAPLRGWGFYSPGLACPAGLTSACSATGGAGGSSSWPVQYGLLDQETAVGCCPSGFSCINNGIAQTCQQLATQTSFQTVSCNSGQSESLAFLTIPKTIVPASAEATTISEYYVYAPLIQINWQASDRKSTTSSSTVSIASSTSPPTSSSLPSSSLSSGAKAGIGIGAILGVILFLTIAFFIYKRRKTAYRPAAHHSPVESPHELQAGKVGSYPIPELSSGTQFAELPPEGASSETRQVHEMGN